MTEQLQIKQPEFHKPLPQQQFARDSDSLLLELRGNGQLSSLFNNCLAVFNENPREDGDASNKDNRLKAFSKDGNAFSPLGREQSKRRPTFEAELRSLIATYTNDLFDDQGQLIYERRQELYNVIEIAPKLMQILTDRGNYITQLQEEHALNLAGLAFHKARNPDTDLILRVGIGGSDHEFTSSRFPSYGIPALRMAEQINDFYIARGQRALQGAAKEKVFKVHEESLGGGEIGKEDKKRLAQTVKADESGKYPQLSEEEEENALRALGVPTTRPVEVQFIFAQNAATAINEKMDKDAIRKRTDANKLALHQHVAENHPHLAGAVKIVEDRPWEELTPYARESISYLANVLSTSTDPHIHKTVERLRQMGQKHGGDVGAERAIEYAASHPLVFGDRLNIPFAPFLQRTSDKPALLVTIGGRAERLFCAVREYLSQNVTPEGLEGFLANKLQGQLSDRERGEINKMLAIIPEWKRKVAKRRDAYTLSDVTGTIRPDRPMQGVSLITRIGEVKPPYYVVKPYDQPFGSDVTEQIHQLTQELSTLQTTRQQEKSAEGSNNTNGKETNDKILTLGGIIFDLEAVRKDQALGPSTNV